MKKISLFAFLSSLTLIGLAVAQDKKAAPAAKTDAAAAPAKPQIEVVKKEKFNDWETICGKLKEQIACEAKQIAKLNEKSNAGVIINMAKLKDGFAVNFIAPLGVFLQNGFVFQLDQEKALQIAYTACANIGCLASLKLDKDVLEKLKKAKTLTAILFTGPKQDAKVNFKLDGTVKMLEFLDKNTKL